MTILAILLLIPIIALGIAVEFACRIPEEPRSVLINKNLRLDQPEPRNVQREGIRHVFDE